ncbi:MAG: PIN/TRAM domain-containing protein [Candidatus Saccharimonadales bacterium]
MNTSEIIDIAQTLVLVGLLYAVLATRTTGLATSKKSGKKMVLDTCALIDGRILEIANAGFTPSQLIIPQFIIHELQLLADGHDAHKRERARFGLDMVQALQDSAQCDVVISKDVVEARLPTDDKLVVVAKKLSADLCTTDYNLNKVATIEGVRVLNVNELANAIRPVALPGEKKRVKIVQKGSNKDQGVGYLEDGSMVVVAGGARSIGKVVDVEVSRFIQTDAGKMLFAQQVVPSSNKNLPRK